MRSHHFLDIPDLPIGAFKHIGDRKIKLFGPVSSAVSAVADVASSAVNTVTNVATKVIDSVVASAVNDPIGTIAKVATAVVAPELLPAVTAADALANGASPTQALTQAAVAYTGAQVGSAVTSNLTTPTDVALAPDNIDIGGGYNPATGASSAAPLSSVTVDPTVANLAGKAASGATQAALTGQNPLTGAASSTINSVANNLIGDAANMPSTSGGSPADLPTLDTSPLNTSLATGQDTTSNVQVTPDTSLSTNLVVPSNTSTDANATIPESLTTPPLSSADVNTAPLDTSLTSNVNPSLGVQVTPDTISGTTNLVLPSDNTGATFSDSPNISSMGGGQGATVTTDQGTTGALGTVPTDASPNLGDPNSIINNPDVTGTSVAPTDTSTNVPLPKVNVAGALGIGSTVPKIASLLTTPLSVNLGNLGSSNSGTTSDAIKFLASTAPSVLIPKSSNSGLSALENMDNLKQIESTLTPTERVIYNGKLMTPEEEQLLSSYTPVTAAHGGSIDYSKIVPELLHILQSRNVRGYAEGSDVKVESTGNLAKLYNFSDPVKLTRPVEAQFFTPHGGQNPAKLPQLHQMSQGPLSGLIHHAHGGDIRKYEDAAPEGHRPEFITGVTGYYAHGGGTGQSDDIPAMLHDGDYVADADLVAALGDGSSKAGAHALEQFRRSIPHHEGAGGHPVPAQIADGEYVFPANFVTAIGHGDNKAGAKLLDKMREEVRAHKRSAPDTKIPPKAKSPLEYLKMAMKG